ncbi:MAG: hypothetical protein AAGF12_09845 [Myxococcota bacterium]
MRLSPGDLALVGLVFVLGCGDDDSSGESCTVGEEFPCFCDDGAAGRQFCLAADGTRSACSCGADASVDASVIDAPMDSATDSAFDAELTEDAGGDASFAFGICRPPFVCQPLPMRPRLGVCTENGEAPLCLDDGDCAAPAGSRCSETMSGNRACVLICTPQDGGRNDAGSDAANDAGSGS